MGGSIFFEASGPTWTSWSRRAAHLLPLIAILLHYPLDAVDQKFVARDTPQHGLAMNAVLVVFHCVPPARKAKAVPRTSLLAFMVRHAPALLLKVDCVPNSVEVETHTSVVHPSAACPRDFWEELREDAEDRVVGVVATLLWQNVLSVRAQTRRRVEKHSCNSQVVAVL